jgi:hypothetical protein
LQHQFWRENDSEKSEPIYEHIKNRPIKHHLTGGTSDSGNKEMEHGLKCSQAERR